MDVTLLFDETEQETWVCPWWGHDSGEGTHIGRYIGWGEGTFSLVTDEMAGDVRLRGANRDLLHTAPTGLSGETAALMLSELASSGSAQDSGPGR